MASKDEFIGHVDSLDGSCVRGWACGGNNDPVIVEVLLNGLVVGTASCQEDRIDVETAGFRKQSGFGFNLVGVIDPSKNNKIQVRIAGSDKVLHGPTIVERDSMRERMREEGFGISDPIFVATARSYEMDGNVAVVRGEVKTNGSKPETVRVQSGGRLLKVRFDDENSNPLLQSFGISVYSYSATFELFNGPALQFEFESPNQIDIRPICAIPGFEGPSSFAPSEESRKRVVGQMTPNSYITLAYTTSAILWNLAKDEGSTGVWLDWGCGPGRTTIPLKRVFAKNWQVLGCDIDSYNIDVLKGLDPEIPATVTELYPPLPYKKNTFDVVQGISVLTHLREATQRKWVDELARIMKPGGLALLTTHGELAMLMSSFIDDKSIYPTFVRRGISDELIDNALGAFDTDAGYYRATFQSKANARALFERRFDIVRYIVGGHHNHQDLWVLRLRSPRRHIKSAKSSST